MSSSKFIAASLSITGTREMQQDAALVYEYRGGLLAVVCDGMGGFGGGEVASKTAVATLKSLFEKKDISRSNSDFFREAADIIDEGRLLPDRFPR